MIDRMQQVIRAACLLFLVNEVEEEPHEVVAESHLVTREQSREAVRDHNHHWGSLFMTCTDCKPLSSMEE